MSRSVWKPKHIHFHHRCSIYGKDNGSRCKVMSSSFLGKNVEVYNGKYTVLVFCNKDRLGFFKFGEFSYTKKRCLPPLKKRKKKKSK
jgi:ribosomal protein S19